MIWNVGSEVRVWKESGLLGRRVLAAEPAVLDEMWRDLRLADRAELVRRRHMAGARTAAARARPARRSRARRLPPARADGAREPVEAGARLGGVGARARDRSGDSRALPDLRRAPEAHRRRRRAAPRPADQARRLLNDAISQFEQAATLARRSPDPWLGLLRLYATSRRDPDQAQVALNEAVRRDYAAGPREYALLGDAARDKARTSSAAAAI